MKMTLALALPTLLLAAVQCLGRSRQGRIVQHMHVPHLAADLPQSFHVERRQFCGNHTDGFRPSVLGCDLRPDASSAHPSRPTTFVTAMETKKTDVAEHPQAFDHVGLLFNDPSGNAKLVFI